MGDTVITEALSTPPTHHDQCDRCPAAARLQSLLTHLVFGLGLYAAGWVNSFLNPWSMT